MSWLQAVIDAPADRVEVAARFWAQALGWPAGAPWPGHPELRSFEPPAGCAYLHVQRIDGPARVHLDLDAVDPEATVARALDLGADLLARRDRWQTLVSPGGLPFCVVQSAEHDPPQPTRYPDGHRSRVVQVCIDSPGARHSREVNFWRDLLGGRWVPSSDDEFAGKWHDDAGSPLQLLFQQLDESDGSVRAHLDVGTDDVLAETRRLLALGARDLGPGRGWHVLQDTAGLPFCVTANSPDYTLRRHLG